MAEQDDAAEKSHEPTPEKLAEAKRKGDVPRSQDVAVAAIYIAVLVALGAGGGAMAMDSGAALAGIVANADRLEGLVLGPGGRGVSAALVGDAVAPLAPLLLAPFVAAVLAHLAQGSWVVSGEKLAPKLNRIDPIQGAGRKFGPTGLFEFAKAVVKLVVISIILTVFLVAESDRILGTVRADPRVVGPLMMDFGGALLAVVAAVSVAVAALDWAWQRHDHARKLRMSFQELKDESKRVDGDPHMKSERRRRAESIATNRMLQDVPDAAVVLTNPTHVAVALAWSRAPGSAPKVVAKGVDAVAMAIRARAAEAGVPVREDPPTARLLNDSLEIGETIHAEHYRAVAAAIRWADAMRAVARERGAGPPPGTGR